MHTNTQIQVVIEEAVAKIEAIVQRDMTAMQQEFNSVLNRIQDALRISAPTASVVSATEVRAPKAAKKVKTVNPTDVQALPKSAEKLLAYIQENPAQRTEEIVAGLGKAKGPATEGIKRDLKTLREVGIIRSKGAKRAMAWTANTTNGRTSSPA